MSFFLYASSNVFDFYRIFILHCRFVSNRILLNFLQSVKCIRGEKKLIEKIAMLCFSWGNFSLGTFFYNSLIYKSFCSFLRRYGILHDFSGWDFLRSVMSKYFFSVLKADGKAVWEKSELRKSKFFFVKFIQFAFFSW